MTEIESLKAVVQNVIPNGKHGPYAVAYSEYLNMRFTFSLKEGTWLGNKWPEPGSIILAKKFEEKRAGWRAHQAWFTKLDEQ